ncbi:hypothetical protein DFQ26_003907 [Actinomortierella ambigua]|nr:hypothetical protein DFQ26_003907 [Actinomortierella ambigua]
MELTTPWRILYGDRSSVSGHLAIDRLEFSEVVIENQLIGLADQESTSFMDDAVDGVFGLGFPANSAFNLAKSQHNLQETLGGSAQGDVELNTTVLGSIMKHDILPRSIFSVWLGGGGGDKGWGNNSIQTPEATNPSTDDKNTHGENVSSYHDELVDGEYLFGSIDTSRFEGNLTYAPIVSPNFWQVKVDGITLDHGRLDLHLHGEAIIDTGTTLLVFPTVHAKAINTALGAVSDPWEGWIVPCDHQQPNGQQGSLDFQIGGASFSVRRLDLVREPASTRPGYCYSAVIPSPAANTIILGDIFIRNNYCVFDLERLAIGFAPLAKII